MLVLPPRSFRSKGHPGFWWWMSKISAASFPILQIHQAADTVGYNVFRHPVQGKLIIILMLFIGFTHHSLYFFSPGPDKSFVLLFKKKPILAPQLAELLRASFLPLPPSSFSCNL